MSEQPIISKEHYLRIEYDKDKNIINITGNSTGLRYLGEVCQLLSEKKDAEHWHLSHGFYSLSEESVETIIYCEKKAV